MMNRSLRFSPRVVEEEVMWRMTAPTLLTLAVLAGPAGAHYSMLLPAAASGKKGEAITLTYQWGHPFEHQLFDAPPPLSLTVRAPDGKQTDLTGSLEKTTVGEGDKKAAAYRLRFTPAERGDYAFVLRTPPIWMEDEKEFWQDTVKVVLHVQAQKGWDKARSNGEWVPLTRPYGLPPGVAFQARLRIPFVESEPPPGRVVAAPPWVLRSQSCLVEIERYNSTQPNKLPPDEQITRTAKTDSTGVVTATLTDPGWWCLTATVKDSDKKDREGKEYPVRQRSTLWVYVDDRPAGR
jgi:uncharacterized GH25 family protein